MRRQDQLTGQLGESGRRAGAVDLRIEQACPQCGAPVELAETHQLLICAFCGVRNHLEGSRPFRFVLPAARSAQQRFLYAPYLRFKGTIFLVSGESISHRVVDTTQVAHPATFLPPSLGVRPQAMRLQRLDPDTSHHYLKQTISPTAVLAKAAQVSSLTGQAGRDLLHRAYIGESLSCIYLPLTRRQQTLVDAVTGQRLAGSEELIGLTTQPFQEPWRIRCRASLCLHCGGPLHGAADCQVLTCANCHRGWTFADQGLIPVDWQIVPGDPGTPLYLPFWQLFGRIPVLEISSYADFVVRTNQPFLPRPEWRERPMSLWAPAFKLRPKIFLQAGRQATIAQWQLRPQPGRVQAGLFPVTLPSSEALQAAKIILATTTTSPRLVFPLLPRVNLTDVVSRLVYLPFVEKGYDWLQPHTGVVIGKNILRLGRAM
ncbi:MAG: hypothetical protein RBT36_00090 [Desulfobulbus sp.]|nr:hypothetical protein [Desulfobulbus sp.]